MAIPDQDLPYRLLAIGGETARRIVDECKLTRDLILHRQDLGPTLIDVLLRCGKSREALLHSVKDGLRCARSACIFLGAPPKVTALGKLAKQVLEPFCLVGEQAVAGRNLATGAGPGVQERLHDVELWPLL